MPTSRRRRPPRWRVLAWRYRHLLAALATGAAVAAVAERLAPPDPPTTPLVVTVREVPVGRALTAEDLTTVAWPDALRPDAGLDDVADALGRPAAGALPAGLPVVETLLAGGTPAGPPGTVAVPVRFGDAALAALLTPGTRVDVVAASRDAADDARVVARGAVVLPRPAPAADTGWLSGDDPDTGLVLLAVAPEEVTSLAGSLGWATLTAAIVG